MPGGDDLVVGPVFAPFKRVKCCHRQHCLLSGLGGVRRLLPGSVDLGSGWEADGTACAPSCLQSKESRLSFLLLFGSRADADWMFGLRHLLYAVSVGAVVSSPDFQACLRALNAPLPSLKKPTIKLAVVCLTRSTESQLVPRLPPVDIRVASKLLVR